MEKKIIGWKEINLSETGLQTLNDLTEGQVLAVAAKHIHDAEGHDKLQIEFAEKIQREDGVESALGMFNVGDTRFTSGARRAWLSIMADVAKEKFGIELAHDESHKELLYIMPEARPGYEFRIQIKEIVESKLTDKQKKNQHENGDRNLKRRSEDGPIFFSSNGEKVYTFTDLIVIKEGKDVPHLYVEDGDYVSAEDMVENAMKGNDVNSALAGGAKTSLGRT